MIVFHIYQMWVDVGRRVVQGWKWVEYRLIRLGGLELCMADMCGGCRILIGGGGEGGGERLYLGCPIY